MPSFEFLGPYRIGEQLGRGGMGTVFAAVHEKSGEKVAVKLISPHVADEPRFRRRFDAEVKTLQRLRHEGIVSLIGFGEEEGQLFYSMELLEGESVQAMIRREKKISWQTTIDFAIQVCAALKHAHDMGVFHRDLKPANLVISGDKIKLVDFGIAKIFGNTEQTMAGSVLGTADYMAPEQATGSGVTQRTDLYALGSLMYAMLTGRPPFTGKKVTEVIESLKRDRPVPLDLIDPELPEALVELIHELLEKSPADRPPTALAVMNRLKAMRVGLQRQQTLMSEGAVTEMGPSPVPASPADTNFPHATDPSGIAGGGQRKPTMVSKGGQESSTQATPKVDPQQATIASHGRTDRTLRPGESIEDEDSEARQTKTHFQTVDESESTSGVFDVETDEKPGWMHWLAIAAMLCVLAVGGSLLFHSMQPPTADELYASIMETEDLGATRTFIRRFPDDPRFDEVKNLNMSKRLSAVLRRFSVQRSPLETWEAAFVAAMEDRDQSPEEASERIEAWMSVYGGKDDQPSNAINDLIELASHEHEQLEARAPRILIDPRAKQLIQDIKRAIENQPEEKASEVLNGIIELHESHDWAQPAVKEAQEQLNALQEFAEAA